MTPIAHATESIEDFFARYTRYLTEGDFDGLANIYNYPGRECKGLSGDQ
jgi:hypothetical protein